MLIVRFLVVFEASPLVFHLDDVAAGRFERFLQFHQRTDAALLDLPPDDLPAGVGLPE